MKRHMQRHHCDVTDTSTSQRVADEGLDSPERSEIVVSATSPSNVSTPSTTAGNPLNHITTATLQYHENSDPSPQQHNQPMGIDENAGTFDVEVDAFVAMNFGGTNAISHVFPPGYPSGDHVGSQQENTTLGRHSFPLFPSLLTAATASGAHCSSSSAGLQDPSLDGSFELSAPKRAELIREVEEVFRQVSLSNYPRSPIDECLELPALRPRFTAA